MSNAYRQKLIDAIHTMIMENLTDDYNLVMVREAVETYLNNFTQDELQNEFDERIRHYG